MSSLRMKPRRCAAGLAMLALALATSAQSIADDLIEVYDREHKPLRTASVEVSPQSVPNTVERSVVHAHVTLTGSPAEAGELVVRQIGGNEFGAFYGRRVPYRPGQAVIDVECHINPAKNREGTIVVQALITSSYKAMQGAVTTELRVGGGASEATSGVKQ